MPDTEIPLGAHAALTDSDERTGADVRYKDVMRSALLLSCTAVLLLAGCTNDVVPTYTPTRPAITADRRSTAAPTASSIDVPTRAPDEVSRDVYTGTRYAGEIYDIPVGTRALSFEAACSGPARTRMRFDIQDGKGKSFTTGDLACNGRETTFEVGGQLPRTAPIHLDADHGVINGWATLTPNS